MKKTSITRSEKQLYWPFSYTVGRKLNWMSNRVLNGWLQVRVLSGLPINEQSSGSADNTLGAQPIGQRPNGCISSQIRAYVKPFGRRGSSDMSLLDRKST